MPEASKSLAGKPHETIEDRVRRGRETGHAIDEAIVPFPNEPTAADLRYRLRGRERQKVEAAIADGFSLTVYPYKTAAGEVLQLVLRFDHPSRPKDIRPLVYAGKDSTGLDVHWFKALAGQRPLYGLDLLAARPEAPVLVVEGEKTAEAARLLFPDHVVTTWMSGASSVSRTEMRPLAGRNVTLWPDNDPAGRTAMRSFAGLAYKAGAVDVRLVDVPKEFGEKWDLADDVPVDQAAEYPLGSLLETARLVDPAEVARFATDARSVAEHRRLLGYSPGYSRIELEPVAEALSLLDPGMYGNEWRRVARCLFYAFRDEALAMFDSWSQGSAEKYRAGEPAALWASFSNEKTFRADTLSWLFRQATKVIRDRQADDAAGEPNIILNTDAIATAAIEELSENHAVIVRGGKTAVLWEHYDPRFQRFTETYLSKADFVDQHVRSIALPSRDERQSQKGDKHMPQGRFWFSSAGRRSYDNVVFSPGEELGPRYLNLWRGLPSIRQMILEHGRSSGTTLRHTSLAETKPASTTSSTGWPSPFSD